MPSFQELFEKSNGMPIVYQGKNLIMKDDFPAVGLMSFRLVFEARRGEWRQGVALRIKGKFNLNGNSINKGIILWQDTAPPVVEFEVSPKVAFIEVKNVWDVGDGAVHSWHNGAAMIMDQLPKGRRYRCNDGFADDDFDDIVFRLEHR